MGYPKRIYYTEADQGRIFERWFQGESQCSIARSFGRSHSSIQQVLARTGIDSFLDKAGQYQLYWNVGRPNRWKDNQTPSELLHHLDASLPIDTLLLPPVLLDTFLEQSLHSRGVGQDVPPSPAANGSGVARAGRAIEERRGE